MFKFKKSTTPRPWRTQSQAVAYNRRIQVIEELVSTPDGDEFVYVYVKSPHDIVATLAVTDDRQIVLVREYRHPIRQIIYNLPSGSIPEGEAPSEAARRELAEEAGYEAHDLTPLGRMVPFPGAVVGAIHLFLARRLRPIPQRLDTHEYIEVVQMHVDEALQRMLHGEFEDAGLQLALLLARQQQLL
jgi:ADP-ribose pyrophosphatase